MKHSLKTKSILLAATAMTACYGATAMAQDAAGSDDSDVIIVTAQRIEQRLQDVPVSISVFNQEELSNNAVSNTRDLAAITPGLQVQSRYGEDATNFSIRGFTQEQRTYATVGVYFADVVAPRGSGATFGGDGGGPGSLFDLQNVQVLKGPQGTLFGRNTSGGAVLLVPKKPTDRFEGYVEGQMGNFDMHGLEGVVNLPVADTFRVRLGGIWKERDGYLRNIGAFSDGAHGNQGMGNVNYWAVRASMVWDITPEIENYTVFSYSKSWNNGTIPKIVDAFPGVLQFLSADPSHAVPFGTMAYQQMQREAQYDPWTVSNRLPNSRSDQKQWQVVNTTTWQASDTTTVKAILSYGEFENDIVQDLFGLYGLPPGSDPSAITSPGQVTGFAFTASEPFSGKTNNQGSFVGELRATGEAAGGRLNWQGGVYTEISDPTGWSGVQTSTITACADITTLDCVGFTPAFSAGAIGYQRNKSKYRNYAVYGQASYDITDQLKFTLGARYTWDEQSALLANETVFQSARPGPFDLVTCINQRAPEFGMVFPAAQRAEVCHQNLKVKSSAPTWMLGLEYRPIADVMIYAKYNRGYRAGGLSLFGPGTTQEFKKERIDVYEAGVKSSWRGAVPGSLNVTGYYNDFQDQQLLLGVTDELPNPPGVARGRPNAAIVNAGKSRMWGIDADLTIRPFDGLRLTVAYAYLNTKLQKFAPSPLPADSPYDTLTAPALGGPIPNSQPHKLILSANYTLPLPEDIGKLSVGATFIYTAGYQSVADAADGRVLIPDPITGTPAGTIYPGKGSGRLPASNILNLNVNWENVGTMPIDIGMFMTNVTNEVWYLQAGASSSRGWNQALIAPPRMYGVRAKYKFGQ